MTTPSTPRKALICGVSGQDGAYLARLLLGKGYQVWRITRDLQGPHTNLHRLGIFECMRMIPVHLPDLGSVLSAFEQAALDEVYNLAEQACVALSFKLPVETYQSIALGALNVLEALRLRVGGRLFHASSAECFGPTGREAITMATPLRPRNPYDVCGDGVWACGAGEPGLCGAGCRAATAGRYGLSVCGSFGDRTGAGVARAGQDG